MDIGWLCLLSEREQELLTDQTSAAITRMLAKDLNCSEAEVWDRIRQIRCERSRLASEAHEAEELHMDAEMRRLIRDG